MKHFGKPAFSSNKTVAEWMDAPSMLHVFVCSPRQLNVTATHI